MYVYDGLRSDRRTIILWLGTFSLWGGGISTLDKYP